MSYDCARRVLEHQTGSSPPLSNLGAILRFHAAAAAVKKIQPSLLFKEMGSGGGGKTAPPVDQHTREA